MTNTPENFAHACRALRRLIHELDRKTWGESYDLNVQVDGGEFSSAAIQCAYENECERLAHLVADAFDVDDIELSEECYRLDDYEYSVSQYAHA